MLTLSLLLLSFACGGRKSEPVDAPATPEGAPTLPVEGQPGPTINPTESQAAVHKALSVRDPEPECADVSALTPEPVADLIFVANHADQPPWASTRAARCLALGHGEAAKAELIAWMGDPVGEGPRADAARRARSAPRASGAGARPGRPRRAAGG
jgi:hypothetical protein